MAAPIRFLSGRQQQQKIGIEGSTENQKVLEVIGQVGIGTTIFSTSVELEVHGDQIITGILTVGNIDVTGVGGGGGEIEVENLNVTGFSTFGNTADFNGDIDVDGHTELDNLNVSGVSTFNGNVGFTTNIDVDGHTELDNVNVSGVSTFTGAADFNGDIDVDGHTELDNLNVSGVSTFVGVGTFLNDLYVSDNVYISGFLTATRLYSSVFGEFTGSSVSADSIVGLALSIAGLSTFTGAADFNGDIDVDGHTELDDVNVSGAITATTFSGNLTGNAGTATALETARNFEITGDVVASVISFDGTGNVSLAATIQPNSVELGTDTTGDYVESVSGTANEIQVTSGTGEGSTPTIGFVANPTIGGNVNIGQDLTVTRDVQIVRNLNVNGNITVGGTSATLFTETLKISDSDIVLGFRTDANGNDVSNDTTASHGGVAIASTEGSPLVNLVGAGETLPTTYKKIMWFKEGSFTGLGTDAWLINYGVGIGSTQFPTGTRLAAGSVQFTENDLAVIRNINASGVVTASNGFVGNLTGIASTASNLTRSVIAGNGLTGGGELNADRTLTVGVGTGITINSDNVELRNSGNLTGGTITKWDDGNGQLADSLVTETGTIVNVGSGITFFTSTGIISATAYFGSGGDLEDIIKSKLEGITTKFKPHDSSITTLGSILTTAEVAIIDNTTVGFITAVGFGSTAQYYFNDVTAVGLTTDANVNTTGIITAGGFTASGGAFTGDGSGLTNLGGVSAGVTVSNNDATVGTASVLNFGEDIDVSPISAGVVTFSLNNNQNFTGIVTISSFKVSGVSTFTGAIDANGDLDVDGHTELDNLNVSGVSTFTGAIDANGDLDVDGHTELDNLNVSGVSTFTGAADFNGDIDVDGHIELDDVNVSGAITATTFTGNLAGTVNTAAQPNITSVGILTGLDVTGHTELDSVNVSGVSTFTGAADFNGDIDVDGHTELDNLNVSGVSTLTNVEIGASLYDSNNSTGSAGQLLSSVGSGISWTNTTTTASGQNILSVSSSDTYNLTSSDIVSGVATAGFVSSSVVMTGTGSVGIGTTNPQAKLHVVDEFILSTAGAASTQRISERAYATDNGTLSWEGSAGQLFSISNNLTSGSIFSVNDVSGIPSIDVDADGTIQLAPFGVTEKVGIGTTNPTSKLHVVGNTELDNLNVSGVSTFQSDVTFQQDATIGIGSVFKVGTTRQFSLVRSIGTTVGDWVNIGTLASANGAYNAEITVYEGGSGQSSAKKYYVHGNYDGQNSDNNWYELVPLYSSGPRGGAYSLDINKRELRLRRTAGGNNYSAMQVSIITNTGNFTTSTTSGTSGTVTNTYKNTVLKQYNREVTVYGSVVADGALNIDSDVNVSGVSTFTGAIDANGDLDVDGHTELDNLNVSGVSTFTGAIDANGDLDVDGHTELDNVNVSGVSTFQSHVHLGDDDELRFGANNDFKIYHDPDDARIENTNGDIKFKNTGSYFFFDENGGETLASFINDGAVNLFYDGGKKFETTGYGATVFGTLQSQQLNVSGVSTFTGAVDFNGSIDVTGHTETDTLQVSGVSTFQNDVSIGVGGTTAFFDVSTGNIGIGTTNPTEKLDVNGTVKATSFVGNGSGLTNLNVPGISTGGSSTFTNLNVSGISTFAGDVNIGVGGTTAFFDVSTGNIGIGSIQPLVALDVAGSIREELHTPTMPVGLNDDIGVNWSKIEMGSGLEFIFALVYCGNGIVLAGSGTGTGDGDVYRSTDFGLTYTKIEMGADLEFILSLVYCGNGIVLAGSGNGTDDGDIYRSTDFGLTFTQIDMGADLEQITALEYCGNGIVLAGSGSGTDDGDIYRSTDFGLTYTKIEMGADLERIDALEYCGNGIVLAGSGNSANDGDVYRSTDFGLTFTKIEMGSGLERINSLVYCGNGIVLAGSGTGANDGDVYRSTDFGLTFTKIEMGSGLERIQSMVYCGNGIVLVGSGSGTGDGDIYRSTDFGLTFTKIEMGSGLEYIYSLVYCGNGIVLAGSGSDDADIYRSDVGFSQASTIQGIYHEHLTGNIGIGTTVPTTALHVIGEVTATDYNSTSDAKLKTNVQVIEDPLEKVLQIDGVSFNWIENNKPSMGVIADNIQEILPELVSNSDPKTVNYNGLIGLLIECVKQQQVEIEGLKRKIG